jgi:hypothetical protein
MGSGHVHPAAGSNTEYRDVPDKFLECENTLDAMRIFQNTAGIWFLGECGAGRPGLPEGGDKGGLRLCNGTPALKYLLIVHHPL